MDPCIASHTACHSARDGMAQAARTTPGPQAAAVSARG